ncbi:MAG: hypothetical protein H7Z41_07245 [Cytophagales bacterium]|nr:hypothetical protein [Armatimonadota bacterium]
MSVLSLISHRRALTAGLPALLAALTLPGLFVPRPAAAHEASCPLCKLPVTQDTAAQDNEVALRYGRKRIEYKCVSCAITDTNRGAYQSGDVTILAPSETKGRPIPVTRTGGKWSAPTGTVFVGVKASHRICQETYRAFTSRAAFDAYVKKNQARLKDARPLTLDQMIAAAK